MQEGTRHLPDDAANALERIRERYPSVHCLTNMAAASFSANALLAVGAQPSLTDDPSEVAAFVPTSDALSVNLGTPDTRRDAAIKAAVDAAQARNIPWVLDPVMIDRAPERLVKARELTAREPSVLRLNRAERAALFEGNHAPAFDGVIAESGTRDRLIHGTRALSIDNGHVLMTRITGAGCVLGALTAAFLAVETDRFTAAAYASLCFAIAGEVAGESAGGPGSFQSALLDVLYSLDADTIAERARVE